MPDAGYTIETLSVDQAANINPAKFSSVLFVGRRCNARKFGSPSKAYVQKGGGVFIALGPTAIARGRVPLTGDPIRDVRYASREGERFWTTGDVDRTHPAVARAGTLDEVRFYQVANADAKNARTLIRLNDGTPVMYERKLGEGKVLVFESTLDNVANDLPLHASFVPLIEQCAHYLSGFDPRRHCIRSTPSWTSARRKMPVPPSMFSTPTESGHYPSKNRQQQKRSVSDAKAIMNCVGETVEMKLSRSMPTAACWTSM